VAEVAEPELMSVVLPVVEPVEPAVPEAPMEVPLPVVEPMPELEPAVVSVLVPVPLVPSEPEPVVDAELLLVSDGSVVDGVVAVEVDEEVDGVVEEVAASSFLPQALRDRAAIRARAAHCAIGDLIIRNSLRVSFRSR
jgi:hypothetical protein